MENSKIKEENPPENAKKNKKKEDSEQEKIESILLGCSDLMPLKFIDTIERLYHTIINKTRPVSLHTLSSYKKSHVNEFHLIDLEYQNKISSKICFSNLLKNFYHQKVLDHFANPKNVGTMDAKDVNVGTGLVGAPACGDVMKLQIKVNKDGIIEDAVFKTFGCGSAIASSSYATELVKGKKINEALKIKNNQIASYLKLPPVKLHCSMLAEEAIKAAVNNYKAKLNNKI